MAPAQKAYCLYCRQKRIIVKPVRRIAPVTKQPYVIGKCKCCDGKISVFVRC